MAASRSQELSVKLTADETDLVKGVGNAAKALEGVKGSIKDVNDETLEITPELELSRINRDMANLNKSLTGLERRKAEPDVDLDITQLLRDEAKVRKAIDELDRRKVEVEARLDVDTSSMDRFKAALDDLDSSAGAVIPGLSGITGAAKTMAPAAIAAGGALASWNLAQMAGDAETLQLQLSALTGSTEDGAAAFEMLQEFAKETPFALEEITGAAKALIIAGEDLNTLPDALTDLGNVAAATGVPVDELATIFQQMYTKGKVSNEEMLQLAERGVPAFQTLADELGVSVEELQKLASEGKLGREEIDLLAASLGDLYPTAMADQAESFNGQLSTLKDQVNQLGIALGEVLLPAFTDWLAATNSLLGPTLELAGYLDDVSAATDDLTGLDLPGWANRAINPLGWAAGAATEAWSALSGGDSGNIEAAWTGVGAAVGEMAAEVDKVVPAVEPLPEAMGNVTDSAEDLNTELDDLINNFTILSGAVLGVDEAQQGFIDSLEEIGKAAGEANGQIRGAGDASVDYRVAIGDSVEAIDEWAQAQVEAGKSAKTVNAGIEDRIDRIVEATGVTGQEEQALRDFIATALKTPNERVTDVKAIVDKRSLVETAEDLEEASKDRTSEINVVPFGAAAADRELDRVARERDAKIKVTVDYEQAGGIRLPGAPSGLLAPPAPAPDMAGLRTAGALLAAPTATPWFSPTAGGFGAQMATGGQPGGTVTQLAPKQTPVKVYIDGEELSNHTAVRLASRFTPAGRGRRAP